MKEPTSHDQPHERNGFYVFVNLVPGTYTLTCELQGFKRYGRGPFEVRVGDALTIEVALEVKA
jgi:hypothetical protein